MKNKKGTKVKNKKNKKQKIQSISFLVMIMIAILFLFFYLKETKIITSLPGELAHAYNVEREEEQQEGLTIYYEYKDTNNDSMYDTCRVTISTIYSRVVPAGWKIVGAENNTNNNLIDNPNGISIYKDYKSNCE